MSEVYVGVTTVSMANRNQSLNKYTVDRIHRMLTNQTEEIQEIEKNDDTQEVDNLTMDK